MTAIDTAEQPWIVLKNMFPRLILLFMVLVLLGLFGGIELFRLRVSPVEMRQVEYISRAASMMNREVGYIRNLMLLLKNAPEVRSALSRDSDVNIAVLEKFFIYFAESSINISQIRWLDIEGNERIRVNLVNNHALVVRDRELQNKRDRYYFQKAVGAGDSVYISPIDLNVENEQIVWPYEPTIRATILTRDKENLHSGVLIINFQLVDFFKRLRLLASDTMHLEILNSNGYWLLNKDPEQEWGFQLAKPDETAETLRPVAWQNMMSATTMTGLAADNRLLSFMHLSFESGSNMVDSDFDGIIIAAVTNDGFLPVIRNGVIIPLLLVATLLFVLGFMVIRSLTIADMDRRYLNLELQKEKDVLQKAFENIKKSNERLGILQDELVEARKLSALGLIVAGVAHELNTPNGGALISISSLQTRLSELRQNIQDGLTQKQMDGFIENTEHGLLLAEKNLRRSAELISSFKRMAVDRNQEVLVRFNLIECIQDLVHTTEPRLKGTRIKLTTDMPDQLQMNSFPGIVSQVLQNLIDNAIHHGFSKKDSGIISVAISTLCQGRQVCLHVIDNGVGIDPNIQHRIFDPFVTSGRGSGHTGLGLYLIHQWIHGVLKGSIKLEPVMGHGTCVTVILPVDVESVSSDRETMETTINS